MCPRAPSHFLRASCLPRLPNLPFTPIIAILRSESISIYLTQIVHSIGFNAFSPSGSKYASPRLFTPPRLPQAVASLPSTPSRARKAIPFTRGRSRSSWFRSRRNASGAPPSKRGDHLPLRWIKSSAMSAGVMPLILLAWARLSGRTRTSFSRASARNWSMREIEIARDPFVLQPLLAGNFDVLPLDIAGVLHVEHHLLAGGRREQRPASVLGRRGPARRSRDGGAASPN